MLKNIENLGTVLTRTKQQQVKGGSPLPWDHPQNLECTEADQPQEKCKGWVNCGELIDDCICEECL